MGDSSFDSDTFLKTLGTGTAAFDNLNDLFSSKGNSIEMIPTKFITPFTRLVDAMNADHPTLTEISKNIMSVIVHDNSTQIDRRKAIIILITLLLTNEDDRIELWKRMKESDCRLDRNTNRIIQFSLAYRIINNAGYEDSESLRTELAKCVYNLAVNKPFNHRSNLVYYRCTITEGMCSLLWLKLLLAQVVSSLRDGSTADLDFTAIWRAVWSLYPCTAIPPTDSYILTEPGVALVNVGFEAGNYEVKSIDAQFAPGSEPAWRDLMVTTIQASSVHCIYASAPTINDVLLSTTTRFDNPVLINAFTNCITDADRRYVDDDRHIAKTGRVWIRAFVGNVVADEDAQYIASALQYDGHGLELVPVNESYKVAFKAYNMGYFADTTVRQITTQLRALELDVRSLKARIAAEVNPDKPVDEPNYTGGGDSSV